jgi:hypothetical protein
VLIINANGSIPTVSNINASVQGKTVKFTWQNPGLAAQDEYQISTSDSQTSVQLATSFVVDASAGEHVCITVTVNREGKLGTPSAQKCVDVGG